MKKEKCNLLQQKYHQFLLKMLTTCNYSPNVLHIKTQAKKEY